MLQNPVPDAVGRISEPRRPKARLNWYGSILLAIVFVLGLSFAVYAGLMTGTILGLQKAEPTLNRPTTGVGLAPDLSPLVDATADFLLYYVGGILGGLALGLIVMFLVCRFVLLPLARRIRGLVQV
jgi:hypothetical protein